MPLIRKPSPPPPEPAVSGSLTEGTSDQRWAAARAAAGLSGGVALLAEALPRESDPRVREAIFTSLARIATVESAAAVVPFVRSEDSGLRTGAIDALRAMPQAASVHLPRLLADRDADVRLLSCELARGLPNAEANRLMCDLLDRETQKNVCAAALEVLTEIGGTEALPFLTRCAKRFESDPFIAFSIKAATNRIGAPPRTARE